VTHQNTPDGSGGRAHCDAEWASALGDVHADPLRDSARVAQPCALGGFLDGVKVIELAGYGAAPFAAMMLADHGADVVRVERIPGMAVPGAAPAFDPLLRSRRSIAVNLKQPAGADIVRRLARTADVLIEPFRPGVCERLGLGPDNVLAENRRLIYARMTGWGQHGPWSSAPGHDINYIALSGALGTIGPTELPPPPPNNFLGDFGGGGMLLAFGIVAALVEVRRTGIGRVIDAAMIDGAALISAVLHGLAAAGEYRPPRGENLLDGGAYFYKVYETSDQGYMAVGAVEQKFHDEFLSLLGLDPADFAPQFDRSRWPAARARIGAIFRGKTRAEWCAVFDGTEACVTPVLQLHEVASHPHNASRGVIASVGGVPQPVPAPRYVRRDSNLPRPPVAAGANTDDVLAQIGFGPGEVKLLQSSGVVA
jgi:alpha-methylacyl-CoA racemase